jgi:diguanylate cyclase (GGDEF)-like protein
MSVNFGEGSTSAGKTVDAMLEEVASATGAMGVMVVRRIDGHYLVEKVFVTPQIIREGDFVHLVNAVNLCDRSSERPHSAGRIDSDVVGFSPLHGLYTVPFVRDRSLERLTVIFSSRELSIPSAALVALARCIEFLIETCEGYQKRLRALENQLAVLGERVNRDPLTGLHNRRGFLEYLNTEEARLTRNPAPVSILLFDLDDLKLVNDRDGHEAGDAHIKRFVDILSKNLRSSDVIGRLGGDEFAVLAPHTSRRQALELTQRLHDLFDIAGVPVSIGCASLEDSTRSLASLLSQADQEMYANKASRKLARQERTSGLPDRGLA